MIPDIEGNLHLEDMWAYEANHTGWIGFDAEQDMKFFLFTRKQRREQIWKSSDSINESSFNKSHPTRVTIHGWREDENSPINFNVINEYLKLGDFNCIMVDWTEGSGRSGPVKHFAAILFSNFNRQFCLPSVQVASC